MATKVKLVADGVVTADQLTLTTASTGTNTTAPATTAFVQQEVAALVDSAPGTLNTLNELAAALGDDANFSTTVTNSIAAKLPLAGGTMTGALNMGSQNITSVNRISTADGISDTGAAGSSTVFNESGSTADFRIESSSNTHMFFLDGGLNRIGVGISSPSSKLHITGTNTTGGLFVEDSSNSAASPVIKVQGKRSDGNKSQSFSGGITLESLYTGGLAPDTKHAGTIYFGINHTDGTAANIAYSASISGI